MTPAQGELKIESKGTLAAMLGGTVQQGAPATAALSFELDSLFELRQIAVFVNEFAVSDDADAIDSASGTPIHDPRSDLFVR